MRERGLSRFERAREGGGWCLLVLLRPPALAGTEWGSLICLEER